MSSRISDSHLGNFYPVAVEYTFCYLLAQQGFNSLQDPFTVHVLL